MTAAAVSSRSQAARVAANQSYNAPGMIRRSFGPVVRQGRNISYGDKIHVRLERIQPGGSTLAQFILTEVNDMSEIYGELRHYTRGLRGLTRLTVRNMTRGWSVSKPFMLYDDSYQRPARSVTHPVTQPASRF